MAFNPILEEIYAAREKLLAEHNGDVHAYVQDARQRALASGRPIAAASQRTTSCAKSAQMGVSEMANQASAPGDR